MRDGPRALFTVRYLSFVIRSVLYFWRREWLFEQDCLTQSRWKMVMVTKP